MASFEHIAQRLIGGNNQAVKAAEDDDKKKKDDENEKKDAKKAANEDEEREKTDDDKHGKKGKSAEEPKKEDEQEDAKGSKSKKKAKDDDEPEAHRVAEAYVAQSHYNRGRAVERARIRSILDSPEARMSTDSFEMAHDYALNTDESAESACAHVRSFNRGLARANAADKSNESNSQREALRDRMAQTPNPPVDSDDSGGKGPTFAERVILAGKRRRGEI